MSCYEYSSNDPIYLEPNGNLWSIEAQYNPGDTYSYASIARLCEIPAADQICVYFLVGTTETQKTLGTDYTVNTSPETVTISASTTGIDKIILRRCTPNNKLLVKFTEGAKLTSTQLNLVTHQLLFIAQEKQFKDANVTAIYPFIAAPWSSAVAYVVNNYVTYNSKIYRAKGSTTNNTPPNTTYWEEIANATTNSGFVITGSTAQPVTFDFTGITANQTLIWNGTKLVPGTPTFTANIANNSINEAQLNGTNGSEAVTTAKIRNENVTTAKIANLAVTGAKIAASTIEPGKLSTGAPTWVPNGTLTLVSTGGLVVPGTLSVTGTSTLTGAVTINANTAITGNLTVTGSISSANQVTYPAIVFKAVTTNYQYQTNPTRASATEVQILTTAITTKRANSKIKITFNISYETTHEGVFILERSAVNGTTPWVELGRNTEASVGIRTDGIASFGYDTDPLSTITQTVITYVDEGITTVGQYTYRIRLFSGVAATVFYLNSTSQDSTNAATRERVSSFVILEEIYT
jgi:hypothetical protein